MRGIRVIDWQVRSSTGGGFELYRGSRELLADATMTEVGKYLRRNRQRGQSVHLVAPDGYVSDITQRADRKGWGQRPASGSEPPARRTLGWMIRR
jgi:hypothetical protein